MLPATALADEPTPTANAEHVHPICGETCADGNHTDTLTWKSIGSEAELRAISTNVTAGNYYLTEDITLTGNSYWTAKGINLCLNGHKIIGVDGKQTILTAQGVTFTLTDCKGTGEITHNSGGKGRGVEVELGATFNMYGGSITGNTVSGENGGGVLVKSGTFNMYGGKINANKAVKNIYGGSGGGVHVAKDQTFNMEGGSITGNTAASGSVTGGGVSVDGGSLKIGGAASISGNFKTTGDASASTDSYNNIYLTNNGLITVTSALTNSFGVTVPTDKVPYRIATAAEGCTITANNFSYEGWTGDGIKPYLVDGEVWLSKGEPHIHALGNSDSQLWTAISSADELTSATEGYYYLTQDITLSTTWAPADGVHLCLNGFSITSNNTATNNHVNHVIHIEDNKTFTLTDCKGTGKVTHTSESDGRGVYVTGTFDMYGGKITDNHVSNYGGGGVYIGSTGTFNMYGGEITDNLASNYGGGGVYVFRYSTSSGQFNIAGNVKITGNTVNDKDNNVYLDSGTTITATDLDAASEIGVTTDNKPTAGSTVKFADLGGSSKASSFKSDNKKYIIQQNDTALELALHTHDWQYTASGATLTATCSICDESGGSVTVVKPAHKVWKDGESKQATLEEDNWPSDPLSITYSRQDGGDLDALPDAPGDYTASISKDGVTAKVDYTIDKGTLTGREFTLGYDWKKPYTGQPQKVSPGPYASGTNLGEVTAVRYYDSNGKEVKEPTNVGEYTVKFDVAGNDYWYAANDLTLTSSKFTIEKADYTGTKTVSVDVPETQYDPDNYNVNKVTLPELPEGAQYTNSVELSGVQNAAGEQYTGGYPFPSGCIEKWYGGTERNVTFKTGGCADGYSATLTFHVTGATNYNDYDVVVTVNFVAQKQETLTGLTMQGWTYGSTPNTPVFTAPEGTTKTTITYAKKNADGNFTELTTAPTDAGDYRVTVVCETPLVIYSGSAEFSIAKRSSSSSSSPSYSVTTPDKTENGSVTVSPKSAKRGDTVTITVTPDAGYVLGDLTVTDKSGKDVSLTKKSDTQYTFVMPAGQVEVKAGFAKESAAQTDFVDVKESDYFYNAVQWAAEQGITSGTDATHFSPNASCTRAQMVTFLWRAAGSPKVEDVSNPFTDVKPGAYYYDAVLWAVKNGVTSGTSATTFSPDDTVTRGQTVTFLYRNAGAPDVTGTMPFTDVKTDAYYAKAVLWAVEQKITNGTSEDQFSPAADCTRGQIVTFLYRANQQ